MERYHSTLERGNANSHVIFHAKLRAEGILAPARDIMDMLSELLSTQVVLAGGAVRDALLERPIKDYDLFASASALEVAYSSDLSIPEQIEYKLNLVAGTVKTLVGYTDCSTPFGKEVAGIYEFPHPENGIEVQLIFLREHLLENRKLSDFVQRMDLGLCRVATSTDKDWYISPEFIEDVRNRTITFVERGHGVDDIKRSTRRYTRLHNKYPGYDMVVPKTEEAEFGFSVIQG